MSTSISRLAANIACLSIAVTIAVAGAVHFHSMKAADQAPPSQAAAKPRLAYLGVYEPRSPRSYRGVERFSRLIGYRPNIAVYYSSWWEPFQVRFARAAYSDNATPMVQIEPAGVSLAAIAAGQYDDYLRAYARAVRAFGHTVIISFGHEMNADWYSWGYENTSPRIFVAAWRHLHNFFTASGARNVTWLWTVNVIGDRRVSSAVKAWWPGSAYVTWIGVDGHYFDPHITFAPLFGATLGRLRRLAHRPILIAEAGIAPYVPASRITDLFRGAKAHQLIGVIWFDVRGHNMRVEKSQAAISAFRMAVEQDVAMRAPKQPAKRQTNRRRRGA